MCAIILRFFAHQRGKAPYFFANPVIMFQNTFNLNNMVTFLYKFQIISTFCFCNILVIFENPCNIDFATFGPFFIFLATFFCNILCCKKRVFATFFNVAKKNANVAKKKTYGSTPNLTSNHKTYRNLRESFQVYIGIYTLIVQ